MGRLFHSLDQNHIRFRKKGCELLQGNILFFLDELVFPVRKYDSPVGSGMIMTPAIGSLPIRFKIMSNVLDGSRGL